MQKTLLRQLKRSIGIGSETELADLLAQTALLAKTADPALQGLLNGLGELLTRVDASYEQYERDLELRTRSLELSSAELSDSNEQLRISLAGRDNALRSLRTTIRNIMPEGELSVQADSLAEEDITALSKRIALIVLESEHGHRELENQKFALDQHAIVSITDTAGTILYANDRFCEISGYRRDQLIGVNHRIVNSGIHPNFFATCGTPSRSDRSGMVKSATGLVTGICTGSTLPLFRCSMLSAYQSDTSQSARTSPIASLWRHSYRNSCIWLKS
jgi:PAS domain-containing protein